MRLIGLTGGIGSGKSTVSRVLAEAGALVIDADHITHQLEERGRSVWRDIAEAFGWSVLLADGRLDRKKLGRRVFSDDNEREKLNRLVHPAVQAEIRLRVEEADVSGVRAAVLDVPLLIEGGLYRLCDQVWVVFVEPDQQAARICQRDGVRQETAWQRIAAQMPLSQKVEYADVIIDNRGDLNKLEEVVRNLWESVAADG